MIKVGTVVAVDEKTCRVRVQLPDNDGVVTYWLPVVVNKSQKDKFYWLPDIGEEVICAFLEHGIEQGFVLGAIYNEKDKVPVENKDKFHIRFEDGTWIEYDRKAHKLTATVNGDIEITANSQKIATITTHNGNVLINGDLVVNGEIRTPTMRVRNGEVSVNGRVSIDGSLSTPTMNVDSSGVSVGGSLAVEGETNISGTLNAPGLNANSSGVSVSSLSVSGSFSVGGTLSVGSLSVNGNMSVLGNLYVGSSSSVNSQLMVYGNIAAYWDIYDRNGSEGSLKDFRDAARRHRHYDSTNNLTSMPVY